jgi:hypothetical protein
LIMPKASRLRRVNFDRHAENFTEDTDNPSNVRESFPKNDRSRIYPDRCGECSKSAQNRRQSDELGTKSREISLKIRQRAKGSHTLETRQSALRSVCPKPSGIWSIICAIISCGIPNLRRCHQRHLKMANTANLCSESI